MIPLLDHNKLLADQWPQIRRGFLEALKYANGDDDLARIMREVLSGGLVIWAVNEELDGFITTRIQKINTCPAQLHLIVDHAWCSPDVQPLTFTKTTHEFLERYAAQIGCSKIKTYTLRRMSSWMAEFGFDKSYTEYTKEVKA